MCDCADLFDAYSVARGSANAWHSSNRTSAMIGTRCKEKSMNIVIDYRAARFQVIFSPSPDGQERSSFLASRARVSTCRVIIGLELLHVQSARSPISANTIGCVAPRSICQLNLRNLRLIINLTRRHKIVTPNDADTSCIHLINK